MTRLLCGRFTSYPCMAGTGDSMLECAFFEKDPKRNLCAHYIGRYSNGECGCDAARKAADEVVAQYANEQAENAHMGKKVICAGCCIEFTVTEHYCPRCTMLNSQR
jgi:hypothetical protein